jgi:hypothetical protein
MWRKFILLILIVIVLYAVITHEYTYSQFTHIGGDRSKLEDRVIEIVEKITQRKFKTTHPDWLRDPISNAPLELDGYNDELKVAVEVQGPGHIKPIPGEDYDKYLRRIARDAYKKEQCKKRGIILIVMDYRISPHAMWSYTQSRLFDAGVLDENRWIILPKLI